MSDLTQPAPALPAPYTVAFPDFVLDVEIPAGFVDVSWRNDGCPRWHADALNLCLFIDYADPAQREFADEGDPRFSLSTIDTAEDLLQTDDWAAVVAFVNARWEAASVMPITIHIDDDEPIRTTLAEFLADNSFDALTGNAIAVALDRYGEYVVGGGAAPLITLRRVEG